MFRKISLPMAVIVIAGVFAFKTQNLGEKKTVSNGIVAEEFFRYIPSVYTEIGFEDAASWTYIGTSNPALNPCVNGTHPCIVKVDQSQLPSNPALSMPEKMAFFLQSQPGTMGATVYATAPSNVTHKKQ